MIARLEGTVSYKDPRFLILSVGGVGYKVFVAPEVVGGAAEGGPLSLWTYLAVRENALDLYGFADQESLKFFEMLLDVPGIGPKSAMSVLSVAGIATLTSAIQSGDHAYLTKLSGIGKRTAEKIVMELRDKIGAGGADEGGSTESREISDALDALKSLGYREREAREALKKVSKEITGTSQKVKEALKILGQ
ncbi:MAG TPA: Holliday junction branch migration protein RuvA [Candidatus Paceibacterota bacterium]|nr:Holliday junction branch migration protein RuvA [Candidatus Paceibacterota bacterium]